MGKVIRVYTEKRFVVYTNSWPNSHTFGTRESSLISETRGIQVLAQTTCLVIVTTKSTLLRV